MRPRSQTIIAGVACVACVALTSGCLPGFADVEVVPTKVVDRFDDSSQVSLAERYRVAGGSWRVVDGALSTLGDRNIPLWLKTPLTDNVRIAFTSKSSSSDVDMKVEVFGDGIRHESGYIVIVGGWKNTLSAIARLDEHETQRVTKKTRFEAGRTYRWVVQRTDGHTVELYLDGEKILAYDDPAPLHGPRHRYFAFSGWESGVTFDDLEITPLP